MNFKYKVFHEEDHRMIEERASTSARKIKDPVTVYIEVELEREKYEAKKAKYQTSIADRIMKLFK